jgi:uncharacterized protein (TIGR02996 family)
VSKTSYTPLPLPAEFDAGLDRRPADWELRLVAADWLEEHGDTLGAECLRWQARFRKRPHRSSFYGPEGKWGWWVLWRNEDWRTTRPQVREVPETLWRKLPPRVTWFTGFRSYATRAEAEYALRVAWGRLSAKGRAAVWAWPGPGRGRRA